MNDITFLNPEFKNKLDILSELCKAQSISFEITDTIRTESEQNFKYAKGRLSSGEICTCGQYPNNYHCWGLAVDITSESNYELIANIAKSIGLEWGGNNTDFKNVRHFEYPMETLKFLRLTYGSYKKFRLTWDPSYTGLKTNECIIAEPVIVAANRNKTLIEGIQTACNMDGFRTKSKKILTVNGVLDEDTLDALSRVKMIENNRYSLIKKIQVILTKLGYKVIMTGRYDKDTKNNIIKFQRSNNMSPNGAISKELVILMLAKS